MEYRNEMKLCFLRHTTAVDAATSDAMRALTPVGEKEAQIAGTGLAALGVVPAVILASPLLRARQTAEVAAQAMNFTGVIIKLNELANDHSTTELLRALQPYRTASEILLVGHMPSLADHITELTGVAFVSGFGKGSATMVELPELRTGVGRLLWYKNLGELLAKKE